MPETPIDQSGLMAAQDACLIAISDDRPVPDRELRQLPPWRAVLIGRVASRAGVPLEWGTLAELVEEATTAGGAGRLAPQYPAHPKRATDA